MYWWNFWHAAEHLRPVYRGTVSLLGVSDTMRDAFMSLLLTYVDLQDDLVSLVTQCKSVITLCGMPVCGMPRCFLCLEA